MVDIDKDIKMFGCVIFLIIKFFNYDGKCIGVSSPFRLGDETTTFFHENVSVAYYQICYKDIFKKTQYMSFSDIPLGGSITITTNNMNYIDNNKTNWKKEGF